MKKEAVKALRNGRGPIRFLEARGGKEQRRKEVEDRNKKIFLGKM
jgi:hypothetical protein